MKKAKKHTMSKNNIRVSPNSRDSSPNPYLFGLKHKPRCRQFHSDKLNLPTSAAGLRKHDFKLE